MEEIGLQDLIFQVKQELLAPNPAQRAKDSYPLFFIDRVELEIAVKVGRTASGGIKLTVLDFAEVSAGKPVEKERGHVVRVSLSPLLSKENILTQALRDPRVREMIEQTSVQGLVKGGPSLASTPK
ncbi:MAG: hypothetical protein IPM84_03470 [Anaerolineae bacterium]|nr:hypothetical protein [Anaerolineae bacterium]